MKTVSHNSKTSVIVRRITLTGILLLTTLLAKSTDRKYILSLKGTWKFSIGDYKEWAQPTYNDKDWEDISVPASWENEGFYGYDGFAWYRKEFVITPVFQGQDLYLSLGYIDDADEVFVNGKLVGFSGGMPPHYSTAYDAERIYRIPWEVLNAVGSNIIAVRVYDAGLEGGIVRGNIGIFVKERELVPELNLEGIWKFNQGDNMTWKDPNCPDKAWADIFVPQKWELQGYRDYDGLAWYRREFTLPAALEGQTLVLLMGKIDDVDEVYIDGQKVGSTGKFPLGNYNWNSYSPYNDQRVYYLTSIKLQANKKHIIAVRVYDSGGEGGIWEGPVGIMTINKLIKYYKRR